ncbi:hypothetical protein M0802_010490 [Mischocyttarus mexicanus]|nr:hypothetical protein M0802_010490 [Mischocyttarus mexicanus]
MITTTTRFVYDTKRTHEYRCWWCFMLLAIRVACLPTSPLLLLLAGGAAVAAAAAAVVLFFFHSPHHHSPLPHSK